jgi:hypothetical protein
MLFKDIIAVYSEKSTKQINKLCGQNAELLIIRAFGKYSYKWNLSGWSTSTFFLWLPIRVETVIASGTRGCTAAFEVC